MNWEAVTIEMSKYEKVIFFYLSETTVDRGSGGN